MEGFLLVDKPAGWTSHDVVAKVRRVTGAKKVGHGGTLDPLATGLLVIGLGSATKELEQYVLGDKTYLAEVTLGATSATDDAEGKIEPTPNVAESDQKAVVAALESFKGKINQLPPVYSAIKTGGKKAYIEARKGRTVERKPRQVTIHKIELVEYVWPRVQFRCTVSKGTYIRALARDLGEKLQTGAYLSALRRERVGKLSVADANRNLLDAPTPAC